MIFDSKIESAQDMRKVEMMLTAHVLINEM